MIRIPNIFFESEEHARRILRMLHKFPIKVIKDMRVGATTSLVKIGLEESKRVLLIVPDKQLARTEEKFFKELNYKVATFGSNGDVCHKIKDNDMPIQIRPNCINCKHNEDFDCIYKNIMIGLEDKELELLIMTYHKLKAIVRNKRLNKLLKSYIQLAIIDECGSLISIDQSTIWNPELRITTYDDVNIKLGKVLTLKEGEWVHFGESNFMKYYKKEYYEMKRTNVGKTLLFLQNSCFMKDGDTIKAKESVEDLIGLLKQISDKSIYVDATADWPLLESRLFEMHPYEWDCERLKEYKQYIFVDEAKLSFKNLQIRIEHMNSLGPFVLVTCGYMEHLRYKDKYTTKYYRRDAKGIQFNERLMLCTNLPWSKNMDIDTENKKREMKELFTQMTGRIIDPEGKEPSYILMVNTNVEELKKYYMGNANIIPLRVQFSFRNLETMIKILNDDIDIIPEHLEWVAKAIDSKAKVSSTLRNHKDIARKYRDYIRKKRRDRK